MEGAVKEIGRKRVLCKEREKFVFIGRDNNDKESHLVKWDTIINSKEWGDLGVHTTR